MPLYNGKEYSHASMRVHVLGVYTDRVKSLDWSAKSEVKGIKGTKRRNVAFTQGDDSAEATLTLYRTGLNAIQASVGPRLKDFTGTIAIILIEPMLPTKTIEIDVVQANSFDNKSSEGGDAHEISIPLTVSDIRENGISVLADRGAAF